jgi:hypothetical protein
MGLYLECLFGPNTLPVRQKQSFNYACVGYRTLFAAKFVKSRKASWIVKVAAMLHSPYRS